MPTVFNFFKPPDFVNGLNPGRLAEEVVRSPGIGPLYVSSSMSGPAVNPTQWSVTFSANLTAPQEAELSAVVAAHDPTTQDVPRATFPFEWDVDFRAEVSRALPDGNHRIGGLTWVAQNNVNASTLALVNGTGLRIVSNGNQIPGTTSAPGIYVPRENLPNIPSRGWRWTLEMIWSSPTALSGPPWFAQVSMWDHTRTTGANFMGWHSRVGWGGIARAMAAYTAGFWADSAPSCIPPSLSPAWSMSNIDNFWRCRQATPPNPLGSLWPKRHEWTKTIGGALSQQADFTILRDPTPEECGPAITFANDNGTPTGAEILVHRMRLRIE